MPQINKSNVDSYIADTFPRYFADEVTKNSVFYDMLPKRLPSNPKGPQFEVKVTGHSNAGRYTEGQPLRAASKYTSVTAQLPWAQYNATVDATGLALAQLAISGDNAVDNYLNTQMADQVSGMAVAMNTDLLAGDNSSTNGFVGILAALSNSVTYAGINRSTYANFQTYQETSGGSLGIGQLNTASNTLEDTTLGSWGLALASRTQEQALVNLSSGAPTKNLQIANGQTDMTVVLGAGNADRMQPRVWYNGRPVISIPGYLSSRVDLVTFDVEIMGIEVLRDPMSATQDPLTGSLKMLQKGDDWSWSLMFAGQFYYKKPRTRAASITGLS